MPELPEVEVTKRALIPHIEGNAIEKLDIRETRLRWPIRAVSYTHLTLPTNREV